MKAAYQWLKQLDSSMRRQKQKILLSLDNAPSHPDIQLSNVEFQNTTHDMGIIQAMKLKFRKRQVLFLLLTFKRFYDTHLSITFVMFYS